jgi:hypothetical protein
MGMMNKAFELTRNFWIQAQLMAPPFVQRSIIPRLHEVKEIARLLARPYLPVYEIQGRGQGGPLVVTYIGLEFAKPFLMSLLFVEKPVERLVGRVPFWHCHQLGALPSGDLIIVEAARHLIRWLPRQNAIILPEFVRHILDVQGDWQEVQNRFHKTVRKNDLRRIRKYGYEYDVSHNRQDFEEFYREMYLPTMGDRHGELSSPKSASEAYPYFRHGFLFRVKRDGVWVSGGVCHLQQDVLILDMVGVRNGDAQLIREGAMAARYFAAIQWANQHGCKAVNFLGTDPFLKTGLFQHKRKWGTTISVPSHLFRQIWLTVRRVTPAVSQFLKDTPLVTVDDAGKLHGLIIVDDAQNASAETIEECRKFYATPGLSSLLIRSVDGLARETENVRELDVVIPILPNSSFENG